jgi:hypothetical protein
VTTRDVRAAAELAKLKLVQGIVNKGTRDAQLRTAPCASIPRAPRALGPPRRPLPRLEPRVGSREGVSVGGWVGVRAWA